MIPERTKGRAANAGWVCALLHHRAERGAATQNDGGTEGRETIHRQGERQEHRPQGVQGNDGLCPGRGHGDCGEHFPYRPQHPRLALHRVRTDGETGGVCQSEREHRHHHPTRPFHADSVRRSGGTGTGEHLGAATGRNRNRQGRGQVQRPQALGGGRGAIQRRLQAVEGRRDNGHRRHAGGRFKAEYLLQKGQRNGPLTAQQKRTILCATC